MRSVLLLFTVLISGIASAKCGYFGIWPTSKKMELNRNGLVILEFYAESQNLIPDLNKKYPIYLQSGKTKVTLVVVEILKGDFRTIQVVFKPTSELLANENYELHIDDLPKSRYEQEPGYYNDKMKWERYTFKATDYLDYELPVLICPPVETKKSYIAFGCGPERLVYFKVSGQDKSELFVRASVKNKTTGRTTDYILPVEDGLVSLGHGMCSGPFYFDDTDNYEVTFILFDQSGNKGSMAQPIAFSKPTTADDEYQRRN